MQTSNPNINDMLSSKVMLVDADYVNAVAGDFANNFQRVLQREIPKADLALWLDCVALDGGIVPGENDVQVIFIYSKPQMDAFAPSAIKDEIDGKAFKDNLGEFSMEAYATEQSVASVGGQFADTLQVLADAAKVEQILVVANMEEYGNEVLEVLKKNETKDVQLLAIRPVEGEGFTCQQLGFSVLHALGISAEEL